MTNPAPAETLETTADAPKILLLDGPSGLRAEIEVRCAAEGLRLEAPVALGRGLARAFDGGHDLIILGASLVDPDGLEVLRQVRRRSRVPIILLAADDAPEAVVRGLDAGADDVLARPFPTAELLARVRSILRRAGTSGRAMVEGEAEAEVEAGGVRVLPGTRDVLADGARLAVTSIEYQILDYLIRGAGRVISRAEITTVLHQRPAMAIDRSLDVHISRLRKKLGPRGGQIRTVRGVGYLFQADPEAPDLA